MVSPRTEIEPRRWLVTNFGCRRILVFFPFLKSKKLVICTCISSSKSAAGWDVNIMENVLSRNGVGSSWIIRCQNESCLPWFQRRFIRREERWPGERARSEARERKNRLWWNPLEIHCYFHAKPKNRNWTSLLIGYQFRMPPNFSFFSVSRKQKIGDLYVHFEFQIGSRLTK